MEKEKIQIGNEVVVYDRYRFAMPLRAIVKQFSNFNDGVEATLTETNNGSYPIGCPVWIHESQLRLVKQQFDPGPGGIGVD